ncbi:MAG: ankyrin repeat domain-containing protein [Alphaproteobacteria bacterium]|nr:ankyrin repeat domain-containing protein [Alphaproteobacteria bacterium]
MSIGEKKPDHYFNGHDLAENKSEGTGAGLRKRLSDFFNSFGKKKHPSPDEVTYFIGHAHNGLEKEVRKFCKKYPDHIDAPYHKNGETALYAAAVNNKTAIAEILLDAKADPNKTARMGESPFLAYIASSHHNRNPHDDYKIDYRLLDKMLKNGADVNFQQQAYVVKWHSTDGGFEEKKPETARTALMRAALFLDEKLCDYLLKNGANPLLKDADGSTARDYAEHYVQNVLVPFFSSESKGFLGGVVEDARKLIAKLERAEKEWVKQKSSVELKMQK